MQIVDSYSEDNGTASITFTSKTVWTAQSFTSNGGMLNSVKLFLSNFGSPTGNILAKIYSESHATAYGTDSLPNTLLATSDAFDVTTISTGTPHLYTFNFSGSEKITLANGTYYVVLLIPDSNYDGTDAKYIFSFYDGTSPTHSGNFSRDITGADATKDLCFYVYKDVGPNFFPFFFT